jgi:tripartite-type tricarboxylate transporter receptor subunit TctC
VRRDLIKRGILALALACFVNNAALAQSADKYPSRPIKILVPYGPGGATDIVARILADLSTKRFGQSVYVENKPGAFGIVALQEMVRAPADGYTLMVGNVSTNAITPVAYAAKLNFDYMKDVVPITDIVDVPAFLVAAKTFAPDNVSELVAYVKKNPGQVRYGTVGPGSYPHYDMAYFAKRAGDLDMIAVPNKAGAAGVINDMLTGSVQVAFLNVASSAPQVRAGNLHPLALVDHARLPEFPNLPTMQEAGFPGVGTLAWNGVFASAGTPKEVLQTIFDATVAAMRTPEATDAFNKQGFNVVPNTSLADAKAWLGRDMETWRKITSEVKIETE